MVIGARNATVGATPRYRSEWLTREIVSLVWDGPATVTEDLLALIVPVPLRSV